ncbi:PDZ domain-containing protein [Aquibacillus salsiterrae]|uniref:PDZ domain-containing protein n=1 Tax=Aquibacillus salsiterrae TaxID=2950439 RepID=UPI003A83FFCE
MNLCKYKIKIHSQAESPAAQAGLQELDVIVALDGEPIRDALWLRKHLNREWILQFFCMFYYC